MHPLESVSEAELGSLARVVDRLLTTRHSLAPGQRTNRLQAGFGIEFLDHREYSHGDDIRAVDWRASARQRHAQIRRYCDEASSDWFILLDRSSSMAFGRPAKWPLAAQCAAAMAYLLIHLGNRVALVEFSDAIERMVPPGRGYSHYAGIVKCLREGRPADSGSGSSLRACVPGIRRNSPVFVISDFLAADAMRDGLAALSLRGDRLHSMQVLSNDDSLPPPGRSASFEDVETGATMMLEIGAGQREKYREAFNEFNRSLAEFCRQKRIHFSRHAADENWKSAIVRHLKFGGNRP